MMIPKSISYFLRTLLLAIIPVITFSQEKKESVAGQYLSIQTGFVISDVNAFGTNLWAEYQRSLDKKRKCIYGISLDYTQSLSERYWMFADAPDRRANTLSLSGNIYYILGKPEGRFYVMPGGGFGTMLVAAPGNTYLKPALNASFTMSFKISDRVHLQLSPLLVVYSNRY